MFLQGSLQRVFDALYEMGVIEPVLEMDWGQAMEDIVGDPEPLHNAVAVVNTHKGSADQLVTELQKLDSVTLNYLAMEVAREYADFHSRDEIH